MKHDEFVKHVQSAAQLDSRDQAERAIDYSDLFAPQP